MCSGLYCLFLISGVGIVCLRTGVHDGEVGVQAISDTLGGLFLEILGGHEHIVRLIGEKAHLHDGGGEVEKALAAKKSRKKEIA